MKKYRIELMCLAFSMALSVLGWLMSQRLNGLEDGLMALHLRIISAELEVEQLRGELTASLRKSKVQ